MPKSPPKAILATVCAAALMSGYGIASPNNAAQSPSMKSDAELPAWFLGKWTREWILVKGVQSNTLDVHYLQAPIFFADVRYPRERPALHANSFADLSESDLKYLAQQKGFTGRTTVSGMTATWHHEIDFQPPDGGSDIGRLEPTSAHAMLEHGLDGSYTESWKKVTSDEGQYLVMRDASAQRLARVLIVAGDDFLYVRNRPNDLPTAGSLEALIDSTHASRSQIVDFLDCEFSTGKIAAGAVPWEIQHSTLPWREGRHLELIDSIHVEHVPNHPKLRVATAGHWRVPVNTIAPGKLEKMFPDSEKSTP